VSALKVGVRRVDLTVLKFVAQVMRAKTIDPVVSMSQAVSAIAE